MRLLLVDENTESLELLRVPLSNLGFELRMASSGKEAIEVVLAWAPDAVVSNFEMSSMDGLFLFDQLMAIKPGLPFILLSSRRLMGASDNDIKLRGLKGVIVKPIQIESLVQLLRLEK